MDRKDFIKSACAICALGIAQQILDSCSNDHLVIPSSKPFNNNLMGTTTGSGISIPSNPHLSLDLNSNPTLNSSGGSVFKQSANIIVVNVNNTLIAVTSICTHQACNVAYMSNSNNFQCPCHGSEYDINGNVIQGPATMPLQKYSTAVVGNTLYVY